VLTKCSGPCHSFTIVSGTTAYTGVAPGSARAAAPVPTSEAAR
jgi:hypothetical protein